MGCRSASVDGAGDDGRLRVDIGFPDSHGDPAIELCGYAEGLEVLGPPEVRDRLARLGTVLRERYGGGPA